MSLREAKTTQDPIPTGMKTLGLRNLMSLFFTLFVIFSPLDCARLWLRKISLRLDHSLRVLVIDDLATQLKCLSMVMLTFHDRIVMATPMEAATATQIRMGIRTEVVMVVHLVATEEVHHPTVVVSVEEPGEIRCRTSALI